MSITGAYKRRRLATVPAPRSSYGWLRRFFTESTFISRGYHSNMHSARCRLRDVQARIMWSVPLRQACLRYPGWGLSGVCACFAAAGVLAYGIVLLDERWLAHSFLSTLTDHDCENLAAELRSVGVRLGQTPATLPYDRPTETFEAVCYASAGESVGGVLQSFRTVWRSRGRPSLATAVRIGINV